MSTSGSLDAQQRRRVILEWLESANEVRLAEAAEHFGVSEMTVRRDLADLEVEGYVRRMRGGAMKVTGPRRYAVRSAQYRAAKEVIAAKAVALLPDAGGVALDASSTAGVLAQELAPATGLLVATNSYTTFRTLPRAEGQSTILIGGELDELTDSFVGPVACSCASSFGYKTFFMGASGVDPESGMMDVSLAECQVKQEFARAADKVVVLADSSKLSRRDAVRCLGWGEVDVLITELEPDDPLLDPFRKLVEIL